MEALRNGNRVMIIDDCVKGTIVKVIEFKFLGVLWKRRYLVRRTDNCKLEKFSRDELNKK